MENEDEPKFEVDEESAIRSAVASVLVAVSFSDVHPDQLREARLKIEEAVRIIEGMPAARPAVTEKA